MDRDVAVRSVRSWWKKLKHLRWYSFIGTQIRVARKFSRIITVSECTRADISREFAIPARRFRVIPNGINTDLFYPLPEIQRDLRRIIVTNSADMPLKGLYYLLQAVADIAGKTPDLNLVVVGTPKTNGGVVKLIRRLGIGDRIRFTGRISDEAFVMEYARAGMAVVPSIYEGFGLPAGEAMACGVPVISTTGGPCRRWWVMPAYSFPRPTPSSLDAAIQRLIEHPDHARDLGMKGLQQVQENFTWRAAAVKTVAAYREVIHDHC